MGFSRLKIRIVFFRHEIEEVAFLRIILKKLIAEDKAFSVTSLIQNRYQRRLYKIVLSLLVLTIFCLTGCGNEKTQAPGTTPSPTISHETPEATPSPSIGQETPETTPTPASSPEEQVKTVFELEKFGSGDIKFYGDEIICGKNHLYLLDFEGKTVKEYPELAVNWIDGIPEEGIVIYGNFAKETGIIRLDEDKNIKEQLYNNKSENLRIDQTINHFGDKYYMTATEIEGNVNNSDPTKSCGKYTIRLFCSDDAVNWTLLSDVAVADSNLEDVDVSYVDGRLFVCYEKEIIDKGDSAIVLKYSDDEGHSFCEEKVLIEADCDHEPVSFISDKDGYVLLYSCDKDNRGSSYNGAGVYEARYDKDFNCIEKDKKIETETKEGLLWYDYMVKGDTEYYLFAGNYITENNMILGNR